MRHLPSRMDRRQNIAPSELQRRSSRVVLRSQSLSENEASSAEVPPRSTGIAIMRHIVLSLVSKPYMRCGVWLFGTVRDLGVKVPSGGLHRMGKREAIYIMPRKSRASAFQNIEHFDHVMARCYFDRLANNSCSRPKRLDGVSAHEITQIQVG
ncbi:hypothetical protein SNOG_00199 [Parastagonospora nodorum SN15]|uniref:Uncharacterized protein n=1 Tax=Phaeosphaeria nodorum (strain SN15 / ATCC MYA-4574 / FGSC 10173) TaxID=321614 RepID=Q0V715_PHANO|nr:hypothetical protein SNOG_00199 [Parastagonospora nodorum SN15]EAT91694.1 hypothetical protein SNOG_00199 [Parastagonospora nodorum SN15]